MKIIDYSFCIIIFMSGCSTLNPQQPGSMPPSHEEFSKLLTQYVDQDGLVDYVGFQTSRKELKNYLKLLQDHAPNDSNWSSSEQMAYWINAYNAFTIELILEYYPVASIKDIGSTIQVPFVNTPWDIKFIKIAGEEYDLNNIEHNILRKRWQDPRIHFAINCASISCPRLLQEAYEPDRLEEQLAAQAVSFINDTSRNDINSRRAKLSKIFSWFEGDFTRKETVMVFINRYSTTPLTEETEISFKDYNWQLNKQ